MFTSDSLHVHTFECIQNEEKKLPHPNILLIKTNTGGALILLLVGLLVLQPGGQSVLLDAELPGDVHLLLLASLHSDDGPVLGLQGVVGQRPLLRLPLPLQGVGRDHQARRGSGGRGGLHGLQASQGQGLQGQSGGGSPRPVRGRVSRPVRGRISRPVKGRVSRPVRGRVSRVSSNSNSR